MASSPTSLADRLRALVPPGVGGLGWVATSTWGIQTFRLATLAVLVNFLPPADFGFFAFALAIFTVAQPIAGLGLPGAMVVAARLERSDVATALVLSLASGLIVAGMLGTGLMLLQRLNPQMDQFNILFWMTPGLVLSTIANTALAIPRRDRRFKALSVAMLAGEAVGALAAILLAYCGYGLISLTTRYVATAAVMSIAGLWIMRHRLHLPSASTARPLVLLGLPIAGSELLAAARHRGDELLIGALFGATILGLYSVSRRYIDALRAALPAVIGDHAWPILASMREDQHRFSEQLRRSQLLVAALVWPAFVVAIVLAPVWIPFLLGEEWVGATPVAQVLGLAALIQTALAIPLVALVGMGHTRASLRIDAVVTMITLLAIAGGAPFGMHGLLAGLLLATLVSLPYRYVVLRKLLDQRMDRFASHLVLPLGANAALSVVLETLVLPLSARTGPVLTGLLSAAIAGLVPLAVYRLRRNVA